MSCGVSLWAAARSRSASESGTKDYIRVIGIMLAEKAERNEDVETLINMLGRTSRPKVREYLRTPCVKLPDGAAALLLAEAKSWCGAVARADAVMCYSSTCITA